MSETHKIIEAILLAAADVVTPREIANVVGITPSKVVDKIEEIEQEYQVENRGLKILHIGNGYQLCTRETYYEYIRPVIGDRQKKSLSPAAMETLAIVAYNQPITKSAVEHVRGVNSDGALNRLLERGLVEDVGRLDAPGKPILYATTNEFLRSFALESLDDMPRLDINPISSTQIEGQMKVDMD